MRESSRRGDATELVALATVESAAKSTGGTQPPLTQSSSKKKLQLQKLLWQSESSKQPRPSAHRGQSGPRPSSSPSPYNDFRDRCNQGSTLGTVTA